MCFITSINNKLQIAKDNIPVIKLCEFKDNEVFSKFQNYKYNLNVATPKVKLKRNKIFNTLLEVKEGYHSYSPEKITKINSVSYINFLGHLIKVNYSSHTGYQINFTTGEVYNNLCILSCIIPKGTKYYKDNSGEYVSEQIIPIYAYKWKDKL